MVYVLECSYSDCNKEKLESLRKGIMAQIIEGVVLTGRKTDHDAPQHLQLI